MSSSHHSAAEPLDQRLSPVFKPWVILVVAGLWLGMGFGDWCMRFYWLRWHDSLRVETALARATGERAAAIGPFTPMSTQRVAATSGGDLSRLVGIPRVGKRFEEPKEERVIISDPYGYRNPPAASNTVPRVLVLGDSYMAAGARRDEAFSGRLEAYAREPVYDLSYAGRGPLFPVKNYVDDQRFRTTPPELLIWGIIEREVGGGFFTALPYHFTATRANETTNAARPDRSSSAFLRWCRLASHGIRHTLPNTSALAQAGRKAWTYVRYLVLRELSADVVVSTREVDGRKLLFYGGSIEAMKWTMEERDLEKVVWSIGFLKKLCEEEGTRLVILLIPDKSQVYRDLLPERDQVENPDFPGSCLWELETLLEADGISVVNLLPTYRELAELGKLMYWADDTHWNPLGMDVAARKTWEEIRAMVDGTMGP